MKTSMAGSSSVSPEASKPAAEAEPSPSETPASPPAGADHLELLAADIATQEGHKRVTDEDRSRAYKQMAKTAPKVAPDAPASH